MHKSERDIKSTELANLPRSRNGNIYDGRTAPFESQHPSLNEATSGAMNSLNESAKLLVAQMKGTTDPKTLIETANALAGTIQTQINVVKLAKELF